MRDTGKIMQGTSGMSLTCHKNSRAVERILPQTEKLKKMKSKGQEGSVESRPIYVMMLTFENELCRILEEKLGKDRSRKDPEGKTETAEKILVGIGSEWKKKEGTEEEEVLHAAEKLKNFLDGKDYYIITSLPGEDADRLGFSAGHMAVPHSVSFTEEAWKHYTLWLSCTLNRNTVLLELGENYKDPSLIRWPL